MTLGTFEATQPISIYLKNNKLKQDIGKEKIPQRVEVFFCYSVIARPIKKKEYCEFFFNYLDIASKFSEIIAKWYAIRKTIRPITNLLFDSFYNAGNFTENSFLNTSQAIETFHRRFRKNEVLLKKDHKKKIKEIFYTGDPRHKEGDNLYTVRVDGDNIVAGGNRWGEGYYIHALAVRGVRENQ